VDTSRICIHCGKVVAPDRMQRCNHCGEWFYDPGDRLATSAATSDTVAITVKSRWGVAIGVCIALVVPVSYWALALLVQNGIAPYDQTHALLGTLGAVALAEVVLGPLGIGIAGWWGGVRGATLLALVVLALPVLAVVWFLSVVTLSGALGEPF
jgi:hypothetical protein